MEELFRTCLKDESFLRKEELKWSPLAINDIKASLKLCEFDIDAVTIQMKGVAMATSAEVKIY